MLDPDLWKYLNNAGAGAGGSAVAAWIARATGLALAGMFLSGFVASWFLAPLLAGVLGLKDYEGAVGFLVGFLAIMVLRKVVEGIEAFPAESVSRLIFLRVKRWIGGGDEDGQS